MINNVQIIFFVLFFIFNFIDRNISSMFLLLTLVSCLYDYNNLKAELIRKKNYFLFSIILFTSWITIIGIHHDSPISELDNYFRFIFLIPLLIIKINDKVWRYMLVCSAVAACITLAYDYYNYDYDRYSGTSSHPITYSSMIVTLLILLIHSFRKMKVTFIYLLLMTSLFMIWLETESRTPIIGFILSLILVGYWYKNKTTLIVLVISTSYLLFFPNTLSDRFGNIFSILNNPVSSNTFEKFLRTHSYENISSKERLFYYFYGLSTIEKNSLFGVGPHKVEQSMENYLNESKYFPGIKSRSHLHNDFLDIAAKFGLPASVLLLLVYTSAFSGIPNTNIYVLSILLIMLISTQFFQSHFAHHQAITFFISTMYVLRNKTDS